MRIAMFGPPGAGKGTQATHLVERFGLTAISTGNLIRAAIKEKTPLGREAEAYVTGGRLVPGSLVRRLAESAVAGAGFDNFILDGYPRTLQQSEWLQSFLKAYKAELRAVVFLRVAGDAIIERLSRRRINRVTGETYHLDFHPPPEDVPEEDIIQRRDDKPEAIVERLSSYDSQTKPVKLFYRDLGLLREVDGNCSADLVHERVLAQLEPSYPISKVG